MKHLIIKKLVEYLTRHLLKATTEQDILQISSKGYFVNEGKLSPEEVALIREEAQALRGSMLWRYMVKEVEYLAFLQRGPKAQKPDDIMFGSAMYYNLDILKKFLENLSK